MPAPIYKYGKQGKSYKNGRNLFSLFYIEIMHVWLSPTYHAYQNRKYIHCLHWSLSQHTGNEGDFGIIIYLNLLQFFQPLAEVRNLPESLNDSSTIFKDTAQKEATSQEAASFSV
jgi:hypothetical protein